MAANDKQMMDLSGTGVKKLEKRDGVGIRHLILDNNELTKLENMDCFPDAEKVSASGNSIVRMYGISRCHHITHLNLSNNNIICIEGLKEIPGLLFLNLSVNNIKNIQNLQHSHNLMHLDLSRNNITVLSDISVLSKLKTLHLNGNKISNLNRASNYLPPSLCTLSLSDNCISDLNDVSYLVKLHSLEQLTIAGNPCLSFEEYSLPPFDYRPFVINWCLGLRLLDGHVATQKESLKAEWIYSQGKGRHFKPGEHVELLEYLCQVCPVIADETTEEEEDEKLSRILHMQRQHKEQFLNEMSQVLHPDSSDCSKAETAGKMTQSLHFKTESSNLSKDIDVIQESNVPSKIMYESAPEVLFHYSGPESAQATPPSFQSGKYPRSVSKSEILHSSIKSPIMIEQVNVEGGEAPKLKAQDAPKSPYQHYEDRRVRPSSSDKPAHTPKGTLVRKISKRATSPCTSYPASGRSKLPHSVSSKSKISPSRSCILNARLSAAKNSSESDTSEDLNHTNRTPQRSFRALNSDTASGSNSPVFQQRFVTLSPTKRVMNFTKVDDQVNNNNSASKIPHTFLPNITKSRTMSEIYGKSDEDIFKAATKIQAIWRGYYVRHHDHRVFKLLQEVRFRRLEDHIHHLHGHLCRLTDFVLRQQQDLHHERELRKMQAEDIRHLHEKARDLQKNVSVALSKAKTNMFQNVSEQDVANKDPSRESSSFPDSKAEKFLPGQGNDTLNLALRYSTQAYQENSGLFSPSSQTSSVTSSGPDTTYTRPKSRRDLQPSVSDVSDADSGLQSMISPNVTAFADNERNTSAPDPEHSLSNGYSNCSTNSAYSCYKGDAINSIARVGIQSKDKPDSGNSSLQDPYVDGSCISGNKASSYIKNITPLSYCAPVPVGVGGDNWNGFASHQYNVSKSGKFNSSSQSFYLESPQSFNGDSPCAILDDSVNPLLRTNAEHYALNHPMNSFKPKDSNGLVNSMSHPRPKDLAKNKATHDKCNGEAEYENFSDFIHKSEANGKEVSQDNFKPHRSFPLNPRPDAKCSMSCSQNACRHLSKFKMSDNPDLGCTAKNCPLLCKGLGQIAQNGGAYDDKESPQSPCTVEMSGRISHSCSFQSDGFTTAEELSATATVKLFSSRAVSMTCANGPMSPQTSNQRPMSLSDVSPQANLRSPLVLAAGVWEKKVQDIESTFHQLQTQIRDLEGAFGQIGQFGQFFYPSMLQDDVKEPRPAIQCADPSPGALVLDMPKINFKRTDNGSNDLLFQTRFSGQLAGGVPFLSHSSLSNQLCTQNQNDCRVEEIEQDVQPLSDKGKDLNLTLCDSEDNTKAKQ